MINTEADLIGNDQNGGDSNYFTFNQIKKEDKDLPLPEFIISEESIQNPV